MKTNEDLLQQAKDQVAKQYKDDDGDHYDTWRQFFNDQIREGYIDAVEEAYDRAALLAIQSAREEAGKPGKYKLWHPEFQEWIYWGFIDGMHVGPPTGRGLTLDYIQEHSKLTAPGR